VSLYSSCIDPNSSFTRSTIILLEVLRIGSSLSSTHIVLDIYWLSNLSHILYQRL